MECKLRGGIAIFRPGRTGIARKTTARRASRPPFLGAQMRATALNIESRRRDGIDGTRRKTGLLHASIAWVRGKLRHLGFLRRLGEAQCSAITMPQAIFRMDQYAERRRLQSLGLHGPALERLPGGIGREIGRSPQIRRDRPDDRLRPIVEGILAPTVVRHISPSRKRRPDRAADVAEQDDASGGRAVHEAWSRTFAEGQAATNENSVDAERRTELFEYRSAAVHRGPLYG